jgi:hypothetical protein
LIVACGILSTLLLHNESHFGCQSPFHYFRDRVFIDPAPLAVARLDPRREFLCPFARITGSATSGNIFATDDTCVVDDMLPRCHIFPGASWRHLLYHLCATVDASFISLLHFSFKPVGDISMVHVCSDIMPNEINEAPGLNSFAKTADAIPGRFD